MKARNADSVAMAGTFRKGWKRLRFLHSPNNWLKRWLTARNLRKYRTKEADRIFGGQPYGNRALLDSDLPQVSHEHGIDFQRWILEKYRELNWPVRVLSIGEGKSTFLAELVQVLGNKIEAHALDLKYRPYYEPIQGRVGHSENLLRISSDYFDLAVSSRGGIMHAMDSVKALEEMRRALRPGDMGTVFPHPVVERHFRANQIKRWMERTGVRILQMPLERESMRNSISLQRLRFIK